MKKLAVSLVAVILVLGMVGMADATTILSNTAGTTTLGGSGYEGHSFTTSAGDSFDTLTFSWISSDQITRLAAGNLFMLTQEYLSSPDGLSATTPGFLAESIDVVSNEYIFDATVTIDPLTQYWVYMGSDSSLAGGGYTFADPLPGGKAYEQFNNSTQPYFNSGDALDFNFILSGEVANPVPEPATMLLLGAGLFGLTVLRKKTRKK